MNNYDGAVGRNRSYIEEDVLAACAATFLTTGYEGTSIDDLVSATGLHRGSLYSAFGSKRGLFLAVLNQLRSTGLNDAQATDLVLVALLELAPRDLAVRELVGQILTDAGEAASAQSLGARLLVRAQLSDTPTQPMWRLRTK